MSGSHRVTQEKLSASELTRTLLGMSVQVRFLLLLQIVQTIILLWTVWK